MMRAILVAEAWGAREHQFQHALVGPSGRELTLEAGRGKLMPYIAIPCRKCKRDVPFITGHCPLCHEHIWPNEFTLINHWKKMREEYEIAVTNVFNIQPPGNDLGFFFGPEVQTDMPACRIPKTVSHGPHLKSEFKSQIDRLYNEVTDAKPNLVIALGNASCWALLGQTKISELRGTIAWSDKLGVKVLPTYHPAAILRQPRMRATTIADFQKASREIEFPELRRPERWITVPRPDANGIAECRDWFQRPARAYACDIETVKGQIAIVGFARTRDDALVIPFRQSGPDPNYWPTRDLETAAWKQVMFGLSRPQPKIFQNGLFDLSYFMKSGFLVTNALHDTMLWHHSLYPELPKSLGYLGSIYANEVAWKSMRRGEGIKRDE